MDFLTIESLEVNYVQRNQISPALKEVNLSLPQGRIGVIIGPSECGKSTLLSVLARLNTNYRETSSLTASCRRKAAKRL